MLSPESQRVFQNLLLFSPVRPKCFATKDNNII